MICPASRLIALMFQPGKVSTSLGSRKEKLSNSEIVYPFNSRSHYLLQYLLESKIVWQAKRDRIRFVALRCNNLQLSIRNDDFSAEVCPQKMILLQKNILSHRLHGRGFTEYFVCHTEVNAGFFTRKCECHEQNVYWVIGEPLVGSGGLGGKTSLNP